MAEAVPTREAAERAIEFNRRKDEATIANDTDEWIVETYSPKYRARARELREQARTRQYLIVSRDIPAFIPITQEKAR